MGSIYDSYSAQMMSFMECKLLWGYLFLYYFCVTHLFQKSYADNRVLIGVLSSVWLNQFFYAFTERVQGRSVKGFPPGSLMASQAKSGGDRFKLPTKPTKTRLST